MTNPEITLYDMQRVIQTFLWIGKNIFHESQEETQKRLKRISQADIKALAILTKGQFTALGLPAPLMDLVKMPLLSQIEDNPSVAAAYAALPQLEAATISMMEPKDMKEKLEFLHEEWQPSIKETEAKARKKIHSEIKSMEAAGCSSKRRNLK